MTGNAAVLDVLSELGIPQVASVEPMFPPIHEAVVLGHLQSVEWFVAHGASADTRYMTQTPLFTACVYGHVEIARWLLEKAGASVSIIDKEGRYALHWAASNGRTNVVNLLLTKENNGLNERDNAGNTPADLAKLRRQKGAWEALIEVMEESKEGHESDL